MSLAGLRVALRSRHSVARCMSTKNVAKPSSGAVAVDQDGTTILYPAQAFKGDVRSTSGLGMGDGLTTHTSKWMDVSHGGCCILREPL